MALGFICYSFTHHFYFSSAVESLFGGLWVHDDSDSGCRVRYLSGRRELKVVSTVRSISVSVFNLILNVRGISVDSVLYIVYYV